MERTNEELIADATWHVFHGARSIICKIEEWGDLERLGFRLLERAEAHLGIRCCYMNSRTEELYQEIDRPTAEERLHTESC